MSAVQGVLEDRCEWRNEAVLSGLGTYHRDTRRPSDLGGRRRVNPELTCC